MAEWRWYACDLKSGLLRTQLPLTPSGELTRELCGIGTGTFDLPLNDPACPQDWRESTEPKRAVIVGEMNGIIVWAGIIGARKRDSSDVVSLNCSSIESYFEMRYVDWSLAQINGQQWDQHAIFAVLVDHALHTAGIPISLEGLAPSGVYRESPVYERNKDQQIYDQLTELSELDNGPEWTLLTRWVDDPATRRIEHVLHLATPHVGAVRPDPEWTFSAPGNITDWEVFEDYSVGNYANVVVAGGEGEGADRVMSANGIAQYSDALKYGAPLMEHRYATQLSTQYTVDAAARGTLLAVHRGTVTAKVSLRAEQYQLHTGWALGDTCRVRLHGGGYPEGYDAVWRIVGWSVDPLAETISPTLTPYYEKPPEIQYAQAPEAS